jgi:toluene monooxygenase system ferredoxin subunit
MFMKACHRDDLAEGGLEVAAVDRTLVIIVWPKGGTPRAFQGFCPHAREALADAPFDGTTLVCPYHDWVFDGRSGKCMDGKPCRLAEYKLRLEGDDVMVDVSDVAANYV